MAGNSGELEYVAIVTASNDSSVSIGNYVRANLSQTMETDPARGSRWLTVHLNELGGLCGFMHIIRTNHEEAFDNQSSAPISAG